MSAIDEIKNALVDEFPDIETVVRKADGEGMQFLNVYSGNFEIAVEWKPGRDFGLSSFLSNTDPLDGAFDAPNELYKSPIAVFHRICSLFAEYNDY